MAGKNLGLEEKARLLSLLPLFENLKEEQLLLLAEKAQWHIWKKGTRLFCEGEVADGLFILHVGLIKVFHFTPEGQEQVLHLIKNGATCGEAALFQKGAYPAHAETLKVSSGFFIPAPAFFSVLENNSDVALKMLAALSLRLRMFTRKLEAQDKGDATKRLASWLLHRSRLTNSAVIPLETPRETLANMLGMARETLSRSLSRMQQNNCIRVEKRRILITDPALLTYYAGE